MTAVTVGFTLYFIIAGILGRGTTIPFEMGVIGMMAMASFFADIAKRLSPNDEK